MGFFKAVAFKLTFHMAKIKELHIQNETVMLSKAQKHKHMKHDRRSRQYHLFCSEIVLKTVPNPLPGTLGLRYVLEFRIFQNLKRQCSSPTVY